MEKKNTNIKEYVTFKNIIRVFSIIIIFLFFIPTFMVSCSGQNIDISAKTAMVGMSYGGEKVVDTHAVCIIFLLLPIAILVVSFVRKKLNEKVIAIVTAACSALDFILWFVLKNGVKDVASRNVCTFKTTGWFVINQIMLICVLLLAIGIILNVIQAEENLFEMKTTDFQQLGSKTAEHNDSPDEIDGYCVNCGTPILKGNAFCTKCGSKVE